MDNKEYIQELDAMDDIVDNLIKTDSGLSDNNKYIAENDILLSSIKDKLISIRNNINEYFNDSDNKLDKFNYIENIDLYKKEDYSNKEPFDVALIELNKMTLKILECLKELLNSVGNNVLYDEIIELYKEVLIIKIEVQYNKSLFVDNKYDKDILDKFREFIFDKIKEAKSIKIKLKTLKRNNIVNDNKVYDSFLEILYYELQKLNECVDKLKNVDLNSNKKISFDYDSYSKKIINILNDMRENNLSSDMVIKELSDLYDETHKYNNVILINNRFDEKDKLDDDKEYKKYSTYLNTSFWEARQKVFDEQIKYPSSVFERTVKEYQNQYLIDEYNVTLEEAEDFIENYKNKYANELFIEKLYDDALLKIREENDLSIEEICDESDGISLLDSCVLELLKKELFNTIREIIYVKKEENLDGFMNVFMYRKSIKLSKLIDRKESIERQIQIISCKEN